MGWLFKIDMLQHQTPAEYIAEHFSVETEETKASVLATAIVGEPSMRRSATKTKERGSPMSFVAYSSSRTIEGMGSATRA